MSDPVPQPTRERRLIHSPPDLLADVIARSDLTDPASPLTDAERCARLVWPEEPVDLVLDTDTYNEIDDQMAVVYALLSPERIRVQALTAAPFHRDRSTGPADGMEKSYEEILRLLDFLGRDPQDLVWRGSTAWMPDPATPSPSEACERIDRFVEDCIAIAKNRYAR